MTCRELSDPNLSAIIARKLANVHTLDVPINKEPTWLFTTMQNWLETAMLFKSGDGVLPETASKKSAAAAAKQLLDFDFQEELEWLEPFLKKVKSPTVFCHNDLQEGNILLPDLSGQKPASALKNKSGHKRPTSYSDDSVVLIDFEYCSYNYRASDIANHFCEWACDYSNPDYPYFYVKMSNFPSETQRRAFITEYLKQSKRTEQQQPLSVSSEEVNRILFETDHFVLASHLMWTIWSINNAFTSSIKFGYWVSYCHVAFKLTRCSNFIYSLNRNTESLDSRLTLNTRTGFLEVTEKISIHESKLLRMVHGRRRETTEEAFFTYYILHEEK